MVGWLVGGWVEGHGREALGLQQQGQTLSCCTAGPSTTAKPPTLLHLLLPQAALAGQLPAGMLHQQVAFDSFEESGSGVTLRFQGDHQPVQARVVVGADGGQSALRAQLLNDGPPTYAGTWAGSWHGWLRRHRRAARREPASPPACCLVAALQERRCCTLRLV